MEKTYKFELPQNKEVESTKVRIKDGIVFVDVEFKEKFQPKDGDFLVSSKGNIFIYNGIDTYLRYGAYCGISTCNTVTIGNYYTPSWTCKQGCRFATPKEKADFLARLEKECQKRWNAEKKCLEDIYIPKFGDIVKIEHSDITKFKRNYVLSIYPNKEMPTKDEIDFFDIASIGMNGGIIVDDARASYKHGFVFKASDAEKKELYDKLAEVGKRWNEETKQLEDIRWQPKQGETYWYVDEELRTEEEVYSERCNLDMCNVRINNCFRTPEAAQKVANQIKEIFKNSKDE